jgi:hypothetical protein
MKYYLLTYDTGFAGNYLAGLIHSHKNFPNRVPAYGDGYKSWLLGGMACFTDVSVTGLQTVTEEYQAKYHTRLGLDKFTKVLAKIDPVHHIRVFIENLPQLIEMSKEIEIIPIIVMASNLNAVVERSVGLAEIGKIPKLDLLSSLQKQSEQTAAIEKFQLKAQHGMDYMYVDTTKLISGDVNEYLMLCEGIGETPDVPMFENFMLEYTRDVWKLRK